MSELKWVPLESNPDVMNNFLKKVGVSSEWAVVDVLGLDDDVLEFVPRPVAALILLFPVSDDNITDGRQNKGDEKFDGVFFMRQTIRNACGTIALIHAVGNNTDKINFEPNSSLKSFIDSTKTLSPDEIGKKLESNEQICSAHETVAQEGQTDAPDINEEVNHHFVAFIQQNGQLYELDGRFSTPINHGSTTDEGFLQDAARVCREYINKNPNNLNFTVVALSVKQE